MVVVCWGCIILAFDSVYIESDQSYSEMTELLTKREREALAKIRQKKWAMLQKALPGIADFMAELNKPRTIEINEVGKYGVIKKKQEHHPKGFNARITFARIGKAVIIGQANNRYPK